MIIAKCDQILFVASQRITWDYEWKTGIHYTL